MKGTNGKGSWVGSVGRNGKSVQQAPHKEGRVRVAVDAMGGDHAPYEVIQGAIKAASEYDVEVLLTGPELEIKDGLKDLQDGLPVQVVDAPDKIMDGEHPILAVMRKPKSSVAVAARLVKEGKADAMMSAGSTGALLISAFQALGPLPGVDRPIIGGPFVQLAPRTFVLDMGANVGCQAQHLLNFAVTGSVYVREFLGIAEPTVALLNVGTEEGKGNEVAKEGYTLLKESGLNFVGNVEGSDIPLGSANVIVCDGFVGNILLKFSEGLAKRLVEWLTGQLAGKLPPEETQPLMTELVRLLSPAESAGGAPVWGVNGIAVVGHGSSKADQIAAAIREAELAVRSDFIGVLSKELELAQKNSNGNHA